MVQGLIAGGYEAIFRAKEGAEDSQDMGRADLAAKAVTAKRRRRRPQRVGTDAHVLGGLQYAASVGAATISIDSSPQAPIAQYAQIDLCALVGPEVITGSTRMKPGTAQKMILNMLSTGAMIRLGKVYGNLMVDVKASNEKLKERACRIVMTAAQCGRRDAEQALLQCRGQAKTAIVMLRLGVSAAEAERRLCTAHGGYIDRVCKETPHDR